MIKMRIFSLFLLVSVLLGTVPFSVSAVLTVDATANGQNSLTLATSTDSFSIELNTIDAVSCEMTAPTLSGVPTSQSITINPGDSFYPVAGSSTTFAYNCIDATGASLSDSVVVSLPAVVVVTPTTDIKANGSDGPVVINSGDTYTYSWTSTNSTACEITSPSSVSGLPLAGTSSAVDSSNPFYPTASSSVTLSILCTDGTQTATDSVIISLASSTPTTTPPVTPPSGGGGGGGGSRGQRGSPLPATGNLTCPLIKDYMRIDLPNDPVEVMKLQSFLKVYMGYNYVSINGVFDQATYDAVGEFQAKYSEDILTPWGHTAPTHYAYILTVKKINEIFCNNTIALTQAQIDEIAAFRSLLADLQRTQAQLEAITGGSDSATSTATTTPPIELPQVGQGQSVLSNLATIIFTPPVGIKDTLQCMYEFLVIIIVLYIVSELLKDVLYEDNVLNKFKRFTSKWITMISGLIAAIVVAYLVGEYCLILPLIIATILSTIWVSLYKKHQKIDTFVLSKIAWFKKKVS